MSKSLQPRRRAPPTQAPLPKIGLLGPYNNLSREQLIEKLLVAEDLLKKIFKENKELKELLTKCQK